MPSLKQTRGTSFENEVAALLEQRGFQILKRQQRIPVLASGYRRRAWVEVDLIAEDLDRRLWIVEAKDHCDAAKSLLTILSYPQYRRLMKALASLRHTNPERQVSWALAWRNPQGNVEFQSNPCYF